MKNLTTLHMRNTHRNLTNMPPSLETLTALTDLDLSCNQLPKVPDALYTLTNLKRLNLSSNLIVELSLALGKFLNTLGIFLLFNIVYDYGIYFKPFMWCTQHLFSHKMSTAKNS